MVTYSVTDQVGLTTTKIRTVILRDTIKPNITMNGADSVTLEGATTYQVGRLFRVIWYPPRAGGQFHGFYSPRLHSLCLWCNIHDFDILQELGATAEDVRDGNITAQIIIGNGQVCW